MKRGVVDLTLEDIFGVNVGGVVSVLRQYWEEADNPSPVVSAAECLLRQTLRYLNDLHVFIEKKIGKITVPNYNNYHFDRVLSRDPQFIDAKLITIQTENGMDMELMKAKARIETQQEIISKLLAANRYMCVECNKDCPKCPVAGIKDVIREGRGHCRQIV